MTVKIYGLDNLEQEPGSVLHTESSGLTTFTETQIGRRADVETAFANLVRFESESPDYAWLKLDSKKLINDEGGMSVLALVWAGGESGQESGEDGLSEPEWQLKRTPDSVPIDSHPDFADFGGTVDSPENGAEFDPDTGLFLGFKPPETGDNEFGGVTKYLENRAVITKTSITTSPVSPTQDIPRIDTPSGVPFSIPSFGANSYLKTDFTFTRRGGVYENYEEWTLSGPNGWNTSIYS